MRAAAVALLAFGSVAHAEPDAFCDTLAEGFTSGADMRALTVEGLGEAACRPSLGLAGARSVTCAWPFAYRVEDAREAFLALSEDVAACAGPAAEPKPGVNHPDSYDLRLYPYRGGTVAVSLKDKAALRETYVFLRMETVPD